MNAGGSHSRKLGLETYHAFMTVYSYSIAYWWEKESEKMQSK